MVGVRVDSWGACRHFPPRPWNFFVGVFLVCIPLVLLFHVVCGSLSPGLCYYINSSLLQDGYDWSTRVGVCALLIILIRCYSHGVFVPMSD